MAPASRRVENSAPVGGIEWRAVWTVAVLEASLSIFEYLCGLMWFGSAASDLIPAFPGSKVLSSIVGSTAIVAWVVWRLGGTIGISAQDVLERMRIYSVWKVSWFVWLVLSIHVVSFALTRGLHYMLGSDLVIFTLDNYYEPTTGAFDPKRAAEILILGPIREEIFFRGVMFSVVYRRMASVSNSQQARRQAIQISCGTFASLHALNAFSSGETEGQSRYSMLYISLQIITGVVIACFYTLRFLKTGCIWETIWLHATHNLFASVIPTDLRASIFDPSFLLPTLATMVIHSGLVYAAWGEIEKGVRFRVVEEHEKADRLSAFSKQSTVETQSGEQKTVSDGQSGNQSEARRRR
ncbi:hypothetical protein AAMO2058_000353100 [Amorphochlora amoebiformis]